MNDQITLSNINIWTSRSVLQQQDILVENGIVKSIRKSQSTKMPEFTLIPSGVDPQVHLRVPGQPHKETPETGILSALYGGVGALLTMPNTKPVIDTPEICDQALQELAPVLKKYPVTVKLSAAITKGQLGKEAVDFKKLSKYVSAFTDDGLGVANDDLMREAFKASAENGLPILQHAECPGHGGILAEGPVQKKLGIKPYSEDVEVEMVARDLKVLKEFPKARYHVLHVSSARTVDLVKRAKDAGFLVSCEVSPHHLLYTSDDIDPNNSSFKMNPPLRSHKDRELLQKALANGDIDFVATDHAPHEPSMKTEQFKTAAFGTIGLETLWPTILKFVHDGLLTPQRAIEVFTTKPAEFLNLTGEFGDIAEGRPFNGFLCSVDKEITFSEKVFHSLSKNSCFVGTKLYGPISSIFLRTKRFDL